MHFDDARQELQEAMNLHDGPLVPVEDCINKGFAYLLSDRQLFSWSAWERFNHAVSLGGLKDYKAIIQCGIHSARNEKYQCYHVLKSKPTTCDTSSRNTPTPPDGKYQQFRVVLPPKQET